MRKFSLLILLGFLSLSVSAQDIHFSQFYAAPLDLNPALTGVMNCSQRLSLNYRNQWASVLRSSAFQTYNVAYDTRIPVGRNDYIGIGGNAWGDQAGSLNLHTYQLKGTFSFAKKMGGTRKKSHYLVAGADLGMNNRGIDMFKAQWPSQNDNGSHNINLPSGETGLTNGQRDNFYHLDVSAGLLWFSILDKNNSFYIGGAYDHINRPNIAFQEARTIVLPSKFTLHAGGEFLLRDRMSILPGLVTFLQGPYMQINGGTSMRFTMGSSRNSTEALQFGLWTRLGNRTEQAGGGLLMDAIIVSTRFDYQNFSIGFSYDLNTSSLSTASKNNGGFEFSLLYKICGPERRNVYCPNF